MIPKRQQEIIDSFTNIVKDESDVKSCFLSGSLAKNVGDDLSDIDITVIIAKGKGDSWFSTLSSLVDTITPTLIPLRTDRTKRSAVFIFPDLIELSVTVFEENEPRPSPLYEVIKPLFDPHSMASKIHDYSQNLPKVARVEALITTESLFLWGALAVRKRLFRDNVWDARDALEKLRYLVVRLINLRDKKIEGYKDIERTLDSKTLLQLSKTAPSYDKDAVISSLAAILDLFVSARDEVFKTNGIHPNEKATQTVIDALRNFR